MSSAHRLRTTYTRKIRLTSYTFTPHLIMVQVFYGTDPWPTWPIHILSTHLTHDPWPADPLSALPQALHGVKQDEPRWRMCVRHVNDNFGMAVGRIFVERHFNERAKANVSIAHTTWFRSIQGDSQKISQHENGDIYVTEEYIYIDFSSFI